MKLVCTEISGRKTHKKKAGSKEKKLFGPLELEQPQPDHLPPLGGQKLALTQWRDSNQYLLHLDLPSSRHKEHDPGPM